MFDKIEKKVEKVRQQPEHIRLRYVWGAVAITMFIVIFIWVISMKISFLRIHNDTDTQQSINELQEQLNNINLDTNKEQTVSIDELLEQSAEDIEL